MTPLAKACASKFFAFSLCVVLVSACSRPKENASGAADARVAALEQRVAKLETDVIFLEAKNELSDIAYLTPGAAGYSVVRMDLGQLTVSLDNVTPYADGSKVTLQFGNLTSARINGLKAKLEWGSVKGGLPDPATNKTKELSVVEPLMSGFWSRVDVVLDGTPPQALGYVRVRDVEHAGISLAKNLRR